MSLRCPVTGVVSLWCLVVGVGESVVPCSGDGCVCGVL